MTVMIQMQLFVACKDLRNDTGQLLSVWRARTYSVSDANAVLWSEMSA